MKIKEFIKKYMIGLTLSFLICIVSVSAITYFDSKNVTYNNETTGMASTNVQDAVNELYSVCLPKTGGDSILDNVTIVDSGDGLYKDEYEEGRYIYKGKNVNNYITFNNETWRIVSIEPDKTIKIMRDASIGNRTWHDSMSNDWLIPASLNTYLNGSYLTGTLNQTAQSQIVAKDWSIGAVTRNNNDLANQIKDENNSKWTGKVALITASEYIRSNSNQSSCGTIKLNGDNYNNCKTTTWMQNSIVSVWWTLSSCKDDSYSVFEVVSSGFIESSDALNSSAVRPAVYLSSEVKITGGDGSQSNPYTI